MRRRGRVAAVAMAAVVASAVLLAPAPAQTDAAFTDREYASAQFTALALQPPVIIDVTTCQRPSLLGGVTGQVVMAVLWRYPSTGAPYPPAGGASTVWSYQGTVATAATTVDNGNGTYTTNFTNGVLSGLISGLSTLILGGSFSLDGQTALGSWTSASSSQATMTIAGPLQGYATTCTP